MALLELRGVDNDGSVHCGFATKGALMTGSDEGGELSPVHELAVLETVECWQLLRSTDVGRLAVSIRNRPDIFPVNYVVDDETIVINTAPGTKMAAAVLGRAVAFEADVLDPINQTGWSVVVKGEAEEIENLEEFLAAEKLNLHTWTTTDKTRYLRLLPSEISGRRI